MAKLPIKLQTQIAAKYTLEGSSLVLPAANKNRIKVRIGDKVTTDFIPDLILDRWDGDISLKLKPDLTGIALNNQNISFDLTKLSLQFKTPDIEYHFFEVEGEKGGFELNIVLVNKPSKNVLILPFEYANLRFLYQPPLTELYKKGWSDDFEDNITVTETEVIRDSDGLVCVSRPENVVGSYAAYYTGRPGDYSLLGGKNYASGKAFHWYRPLIYDSSPNRKEVWGILNVDPKTGIRTIEIPQSFLDNAIYPVTVDDWFGYDTQGDTVYGASNSYFNLDRLGGSDFISGAAGTIASMTHYTKGGAGANCKSVLVSAAKTIVANGISEAGANSTSYGFKSWTFATPPSVLAATAYFLMAIDSVNYHWFAADTETLGAYQDTSNDYDSPTDPTDATSLAWLITSYATYVPAGGGEKIPYQPWMERGPILGQ